MSLCKTTTQHKIDVLLMKTVKQVFQNNFQVHSICLPLSVKHRLHDAAQRYCGEAGPAHSLSRVSTIRTEASLSRGKI